MIYPRLEIAIESLIYNCNNLERSVSISLSKKLTHYKKLNIVNQTDLFKNLNSFISIHNLKKVIQVIHILKWITNPFYYPRQIPRSVRNV